MILVSDRFTLLAALHAVRAVDNINFMAADLSGLAVMLSLIS